MKKSTFAILIASALLATACANQGHSAYGYSDRQAQQATEVSFGRVVSVHRVMLDTATRGSQAVGIGVGGIAGAAAGSLIGNGTGKQLATILGGVGGAVAGQAVAGSTGKVPGLAISVKMPSGRVYSISQADDADIRPGMCVEVSQGGGVVRVMPADPYACRS